MNTSLALIPDENEYALIAKIAEHLAKAPFFSKIGGSGAVLSIMLYARELQLPPLECLFGGMNIIQGKVEVSPRMMNKLIRKAGHKIDVLHCDNEKCTLFGKRADSGEELEVNFSIKDAEKAGIYKNVWLTYPSDMVFKSALSRLAKRLFPDVIGVLYVEDEIPKKEAIETNRADIEDAILDEVTGEVAPLKLSMEQAKEIVALVQNDKDFIKNLLANYKVSGLTQINASEYNHLYTIAKRKSDKLLEAELSYVAPQDEMAVL